MQEGNSFGCVGITDSHWRAFGDDDGHLCKKGTPLPGVELTDSHWRALGADDGQLCKKELRCLVLDYR